MLNFSEQSEFRGVCKFGPEQLICCYGELCEMDDGYSKHDFMFMCNECPYFLGMGNPFNWEHDISLPYFIDDMYSKLVDIDKKGTHYFVYLVSDGKYIKIGMTGNIKTRMIELQVGNPSKLELISLIPAKNKTAAHKLEGSLHNIYSRFSKFGEWFDLLGFLDVEKFNKHWAPDKYCDDLKIA